MKTSPPIQRKTRLVGTTALARRFGVTPGHLRRVITGERRSPRLEKELRRLHVEIAATEAAHA